MQLPMNTPPPAPRTTQAGFVLLDQLAALVAFPADAYLHWRAGRRYRTTLTLAVALGWLFASKVILGFAIRFGTPKPGPVLSPGGFWDIDIYWLDLVVYGAIVLTLWHLLEMHRRYRRGEEGAIHTRSPGESLPIFYAFTKDEGTLKRFLEPAFLLALSVAVGSLDPVLPGMLRVWAVALFIRSNLAYYRLLGSVWDLGDAMKEQEYRVSLLGSRGRGRAGQGPADIPTVTPCPPEEVPDTPPIAAIYDRLEGIDHLLTRPASMSAFPGTPSNGSPPQIQLACPCGMRANVPATFAGKTVTCRRCGNQFRAPGLVMS
jgi:hypothetical protein